MRALYVAQVHQRQWIRARTVHEVNLAGRVLGNCLQGFERLQLNIRGIARNRIIDLSDFIGLCVGQCAFTFRFLHRRFAPGFGSSNLLLQLGAYALKLSLFLLDSLLAFFFLINGFDDERRQRDVANQHGRNNDALRFEVLTQAVS